MGRVLLILSLISIFLIGVINALDVYSGENITIPLDFEIVNCSVINSTYNLEGLNLSWYGKNIIFSTVLNYQPDNLTISCWVIKYKEEVPVIVHRSSGGRSLIYYTCGNGICDSGETSQTCLMDCPLTGEEENENPVGLLDLSYNSGNSDDSLPGEENQNPQGNGNNPGITGAVTGVFGKRSNIVFILLGAVLLLIFAIVVIALTKGKNKRKKEGKE